MEEAIALVNQSGKIRGGLWGLLVGDALGVPYEFRSSDDLPDLENIEMVPPAGYLTTYPSVKPGTWSDDGAQALCLLDSLLAEESLCLSDFANRLLAWKDSGLWAINRYVFDIGIQTRDALEAVRSGLSPTRSGSLVPNGKGNGSLMRVLPLALWHRGTDHELIKDAHTQSIVTHGHITNQVCCALYCLWARGLLKGDDADTAYANAVATLRKHYDPSSKYRFELDHTVRPDESPETDGSGYVVATLHAARLALRESSYEAVVKRAIRFGIDTDTNAAVAGGLAGILYGMAGIPERWLNVMKGKELVQQVLEPLVALRA